MPIRNYGIGHGNVLSMVLGPENYGNMHLKDSKKVFAEKMEIEEEDPVNANYIKSFASNKAPNNSFKPPVFENLFMKYNNSQVNNNNNS